MHLFEYSQPPGIEDRLRHNILPSDVDRNTILESLALAQYRLCEIQAAELAAPTLDAEEMALRKYISKYSSLVAPIRRLTHDILENIFTAAHVNGVVNISRATPSLVVDGRSPHMLALVSHYWKCVALQTAELWSTFSVNGCLGPHSLRGVRFGEGLPPNEDIVHDLMAHAERWERLTISMEMDHISLFAPVRGRLQNLRQLSFSQPPLFETLAAEVNPFAVAPKLRAMRFHRLRSPDRIPALSFEQIETILFLNSGSVICGDVLSKFPNAPTVATESRLHLTTSRMIVSGSNAKTANMMDMFHRLTTPNLERLQIFECNWDASSVMPFMMRAACPLRELNLQNTWVRAKELLALLQVTPTVDTLVLRSLLPNSITNLIVEALTPAAELDLVLPALKRIVVAGSYLFSTDTLLRMLEGRITSLDMVDLALPGREIDAAEFSRFGALRSIRRPLESQVCRR
ncbi:F-box domain-containing protein [Mycena venus]|uniref:F-box domain-containing protein n=1 Tax=Mycena venus TaxID=2733690 RepID=A0A8H7DBH0_9AGAR|nr:F-box domain-containing protein [Mycena venus]